MLQVKFDTIAVRKQLTGIAEKWRPAYAQAMEDVFRDVLLPEMIERTPLRTGALRESEIIIPAEIQGSRIRVGVQAGGPDAPYAIYVHEDPDAYHPIGQWKYIESVINEAGDGFLQQVHQRAVFS